MTGGRLIKVCGMRQGDNIRAVESLGVGIIGFIFYPASPRCVKERPSYLPEKALTAGVFVDQGLETILEKDRLFHFDFVQLHGNERPEDCLAVRDSGFKVIKAFRIENSMPEVSRYQDVCDYFLFDTGGQGYGGSGRQFNWKILGDYDGNVPFLLSGGIGPGSEEALKSFKHPRLAGYDINSRFETSPGTKDPALIDNFLKNLWI